MSSSLHYLCFGVILFCAGNCQINNACNTYEGYYNIYFSSDCYYIADNNKKLLEIIKDYTGVGERHNVTTEDGYILGLFRIPHLSPKGVVLFQHGWGQDARSWTTQLNESIAFLFWNRGYDVWLGNGRGTFFSKKHVSLNPDSKQFWNFSLHEMAYYDHDATIKYIKTLTNCSKIIYVGFSMGFTSGLIYTSVRPDDAHSSIEVLVGLAPLWFMKHTKSLLKWTFLQSAHFIIHNNLDTFFDWYCFPTYDSWYLSVFRTFNQYFPFKKAISYFASFFLGWSSDGIDPKLFNLLVDHFGSATSFKTLDHTFQMSTASGNLQMYDYGKEGNDEAYGSESPPVYLLQNIKVPVFLMHSKNDYVTDPEDLETLYAKLPEQVKTFGKVEIEGFNHADYFVGKHRVQKVYNKLLEVLELSRK